MKVLKKAAEREDLAKEFECKECAALMLVTPADITVLGRFGCFDDFETWNGFHCPECNAVVRAEPWWKSRGKGR